MNAPVPFPPSDVPAGATWFVCHTRPRCEKKFAAVCVGEAWGHFLPLRESHKVYQGRRRLHTVPLFPGYVFARIPMENRARAFQRDLLIRTIRVEQESAFLAQLEQVRILIASGLDLTLEPHLKPGIQVRVIGGPLLGTLATVHALDDRGSLVIAMDVLQKGVRVRIDPQLVEPLN